jgi:hypothetical protein
MKTNLLAIALASVLTAGICGSPLTGIAAEKAKEKTKPYPLETCAVTDEKLGEMGDPYVFTLRIAK